MITVDTAVAGMRELDPRNGRKELLSGSVFSKIPYLPQILSRPGWLTAFLLDGWVPKLENIVVPGQGPMPLIHVTAALGKSAVTWADLKWIREKWNGPIVVKGALIAEDARRAVDEGASAIVVSNHGPRQLDYVLPTIRALPEIVAAVGGNAEILMDGGIRRGSDIVKALCLGARAVLVGRAYAYGLAAEGHAGVARAIKILRDDVERTLRLLGCGSVQELNTSYIESPCEWRKAANA